jgi:hypothetical protein
MSRRKRRQEEMPGQVPSEDVAPKDTQNKFHNRHHEDDDEYVESINSIHSYLTDSDSDSPDSFREHRVITFADEHNLPLEHVKEYQINEAVGSVVHDDDDDLNKGCICVIL